jgi:uncharacterized protein YjbJ (UPF0337 family)
MQTVLAHARAPGSTGVARREGRPQKTEGAWNRAPVIVDSTAKEIHMNWDRIEGNWKQLTGRAKAQWGKLTDDDLDVVAGRREQLSGKIQERYGIAKDEAERQVADWQVKASDEWFVKPEKRA